MHLGARQAELAVHHFELAAEGGEAEAGEAFFHEGAFAGGPQAGPVDQRQVVQAEGEVGRRAVEEEGLGALVEAAAEAAGGGQDAGHFAEGVEAGELQGAEGGQEVCADQGIHGPFGVKGGAAAAIDVVVTFDTDLAGPEAEAGLFQDQLAAVAHPQAGAQFGQGRAGLGPESIHADAQVGAEEGENAVAGRDDVADLEVGGVGRRGRCLGGDAGARFGFFRSRGGRAEPHEGGQFVPVEVAGAQIGAEAEDAVAFGVEEGGEFIHGAGQVDGPVGGVAEQADGVGGVILAAVEAEAAHGDADVGRAVGDLAGVDAQLEVAGGYEPGEVGGEAQQIQVDAEVTVAEEEVFGPHQVVDHGGVTVQSQLGAEPLRSRAVVDAAGEHPLAAVVEAQGTAVGAGLDAQGVVDDAAVGEVGRQVGREPVQVGGEGKAEGLQAGAEAVEVEVLGE